MLPHVDVNGGETVCRSMRLILCLVNCGLCGLFCVAQTVHLLCVLFSVQAGRNASEQSPAARSYGLTRP